MKQYTPSFLKLKNRNVLVSALLVGALSVPVITQASTTPGNPDPTPARHDGSGSQSIVNALLQLQNALTSAIRSTYLAAVQTINHYYYQFDKALPELVNTHRQTANTQTQKITNALSTVTLQQELQEIPQKADNNYQNQTAVAANYNSVFNESSDSLPTPQAPTTGLPDSGIIPGTNSDAFLDFNSLFLPMQYDATPSIRTLPQSVCTFANGTLMASSGLIYDPIHKQQVQQLYQCAIPEKLNNPKLFLKYLTRSYQPLVDTADVDFGKLKDNPTARNLLKQDPTYQNFKASLRSQIATSSIAYSNLNALIAERTPVLDDKGNVLAPSKLQALSEMAQHRLQDGKWVQHLATTTPANIQRETAIILAEIENQLYQQHLDNERLLATYSAMLLQSAQMSAMQQKTQNQQLNQAISTAITSASAGH